MDSLSNKFFRAFEGTRSAYPIAIFRIAFFVGLALHFFPSLIDLDVAYASGALRTEEWNAWLFRHFTGFSRGMVRLASIATMLGCVAAVVGYRTRIAAIVCGVGFYAFASFNGFPVQTLAIVDAWAYLLLFMICGGGSTVLSVDAFLARRSGREAEAREPKLLSNLVLYQTLLAVFFAGVEKLLAGWPGTNEMGILLSYPKGFIVRDWVAASSWLHGAGVGRAFTWYTVIVELGAPIVLLVRAPPRRRIAALIAYEVFFLGIVAMMEVPPLFYCMFAFGGLLALDDADVERILARLRRARS